MYRAESVRWWFGPGRDPVRTQPLLAQALRALSDVDSVKDGRRKALYRLALLGDDADHLLKVTHYDRGTPWTRRLRRSKARRELAIATQLAASGISVPLPVAAGELRRSGMLSACFLLVPLVADAIDLLALLRDDHVSGSERRAAATALGVLTHELHELGLEQPDFAPNNFLVRRRDPLQLLPIDFERARLRQRLGPAERRPMLAKLERHLFACSAQARLRLLTGYAGGTAEARSWWRALEPEAARLIERDTARLARIATRDTRRYHRVRWGSWRGWARRDAAGSALAEQWVSEGASDASVPGAFAVRGELWSRAYRARSNRRTAEIWASALALWTRGGLVPGPVCLLRRGDELRLILERDPGVDADVTGSLAGSEAARAAVTVLIDRLLGLGRVDPGLAPEGIAIGRRRDGGHRAALLDAAAFRPGRPHQKNRRARAREITRALAARSAAQS